MTFISTRTLDMLRFPRTHDIAVARPVLAKVRPMATSATALAVLLALAGCVTINIYFPAAAAEKAADRIIDEVLQTKEGGAPTTVKPAPAEAK